MSRVLADADAAAGRRRRLALVLAPVAAALLITSIFLGFWIAQTSIPASGVRTKGPVALEVYIQRDGQISPVAMGERFRPSDRIQFIYSSGIQRYVFLVSLDDGGAVTNFNYQARPTSVPIEPGVEMVLEGSIILDESPHPERVFAVFSMQPLPWREIEEATRSAHDQLMRERQRVQNLKRLPLDHPQATVLLNKAPNRAERGQP